MWFLKTKNKKYLKAIKVIAVKGQDEQLLAYIYVPNLIGYPEVTTELVLEPVIEIMKG